MECQWPRGGGEGNESSLDRNAFILYEEGGQCLCGVHFEVSGDSVLRQRIERVLSVPIINSVLLVG